MERFELTRPCGYSALNVARPIQIFPVPKVGFEPTRDYSHSALNAACIPVSPLRQNFTE